MQTKEDTKIDWVERDVTKYVKDRLTYLHWIKKPRFDKYWKYRAEYSQDNVQTTTEDGMTNYHLNVGFALVETKTAEVYASTPKYDFVWMDDDGRKNKRLVEKIWEWIWKSSNTNKAVGKVIRDAMNYWSWFGKEVFLDIKRTVKVPTTNSDGTISVNEKEITVYRGCKLMPLEWHNVYVNWSSMEDCTEAIIISHWDKDEWESVVGSKYWYTCNDVEKGRQYYVSEWKNELVVRDTSRGSTTPLDNDNTISQLEYYNKYRDEYFIIAWDTWINKEAEDCILQDPHKEIPIIIYYDYEVENDIYGRGEFDITEKSRKLMDDIRSYAIEVIKLQGGIITVDPDSDFDEVVTQLWLKSIVRVKKEELWHFVPNLNISSLELVSSNLANEIITEAWVDYRWQLFWPNETAEKTKWRIEAQRKRVNKNVRDNAYGFYERLARLRLENIKTYYKGETMKVPVGGWDISESGSYTPLGNGEYGIMKVTEGMLRWDILLLPVIESIYWDSSKEQRQKFLDFFQLVINLKDKNWQPLIDPAILMDAGKWIIDDVVDIDKVLGANAIVDREINDMLKKRGIEDMAVLEWESPLGWPSPYQQSGAPIILPSQAKSNE